MTASAGDGVIKVVEMDMDALEIQGPAYLRYYYKYD